MELNSHVSVKMDFYTLWKFWQLKFLPLKHCRNVLEANGRNGLRCSSNHAVMTLSSVSLSNRSSRSTSRITEPDWLLHHIDWVRQEIVKHSFMIYSSVFWDSVWSVWMLPCWRACGEQNPAHVKLESERVSSCQVNSPHQRTTDTPEQTPDSPHWHSASEHNTHNTHTQVNV